MRVLNIMLAHSCLLLVLAGCATKQTHVHSGRTDVLYSCDCGPSCECNTLATKPGKCTCGVPLKWGHVLKVEGNEALLCQCGEGCQCVGLNPENASQCVCGTPVKRVNLAGSGIYFCNCGGACSCNWVSAQSGKCKCGMDLKTVE